MDVTQLQYMGDKYKLYTGTYAQAMPQLIADGRRPASVEDIVRARDNSFSRLVLGLTNYAQTFYFLSKVEKSRVPDETLNAFFFGLNYFHTSDGFHNGNIVLNPEQLKRINPASELKEGALQADGTLEGLFVDAANSTGFMEHNAKKNPSWKYVLRLGEDASLQESYAGNLFILSSMFNHTSAMGIHLPKTRDLMPIRVQSIQKGSGLYGNNPMDKANVRLLGIKD